MEAVLTGLVGKYAGKQAILKRSRLRIGREAGNNLTFADDPLVSRQHAILYEDNGAWYIEDLGSSNGTWVDDRMVLPKVPHRLTNDCRLRFGGQVLRLQTRPMPPPILRPVKPSRPETPVKKRAEWLDRTASVSLHGISLSGPLIFLGDRLVQGNPARRNRSEEPSLIDPRFPLASNWDTEPVPRMLPYASLTAGARTRYVRWIAGGRQTEVEGPLLRLYLCGLERALFARQPVELTPHQRGEVLQELANLRERPFTQDLEREAINQLLALATCMDHPDRLNIAAAAAMKWSGVQPTEAILVTLARTQRTLTPELAGALSRFSQEYAYFRPIQSDRRIFRKMVQLGFARVYPEGVVPALVKGQTRIYHSVVNRALERADDLRETVPYRAELPHDVRFLLQKLHSESWRTVSLTRNLLERTVSPLEQVALAHRLPPEVRADVPVVREAAKRLLPLANQRLAVPLRQLANQPDLDAAGARRLLKRLVPVLGAVGLAMAPDPALSNLPGLTSEVPVLFAEMEPLLDDGTADVATVAAASIGLLALAVYEDAPSEEEVEALANSIQAKLQLGDRERIRIHLHLSWNMRQKPKLTKALAARVPVALREAAAEILVRQAEASGPLSPAEMKKLLKAFQALGFEEQQVYERLHMGTAAAPSHKARSRTARRVEVDPETLAQRLAETERVSHLLAEVFAEPEEPQPEPQVVEAAATGVDSLLAALPQGEMSRAEFEALAADAGIAPNLAYDRLNELALDRAEGNLLYGEDPIEIDAEILGILRP